MNCNITIAKLEEMVYHNKCDAPFFVLRRNSDENRMGNKSLSR